MSTNGLLAREHLLLPSILFDPFQEENFTYYGNYGNLHNTFVSFLPPPPGADDLTIVFRSRHKRHFTQSTTCTTQPLKKNSVRHKNRRNKLDKDAIGFASTDARQPRRRHSYPPARHGFPSPLKFHGLVCHFLRASQPESS